MCQTIQIYDESVPYVETFGMTCSSPLQMFLLWMVFGWATESHARMQGFFGIGWLGFFVCLFKSVCVSFNDLILKSTFLKIGV